MLLKLNNSLCSRKTRKICHYNMKLISFQHEKDRVKTRRVSSYNKKLSKIYFVTVATMCSQTKALYQKKMPALRFFSQKNDIQKKYHFLKSTTNTI